MNQLRGGGLTRRKILLSGATLPFVTMTTRKAGAAEFELKFATGQDPTHPVNTRAEEACKRIFDATNGRVKISIFPTNQLGSDTDLLSQVRSGGVSFFILSSAILASYVPVAGILNLGFAFDDYHAVWNAADGALGEHIRNEISKTSLVVVGNVWDNGFRQVTSATREIRSPDDLKGFKIRVPLAPILTSLFRAFEAAPTPINSNELYAALQTRIVDGQENSLAIIKSLRLYEVQKSLSLTKHVWDGFWILGNRRSWNSLPEEFRSIITREITRSGVEQRADIAKLDFSLQDDVKKGGLQIIDVDRTAFRDRLSKTSYYKFWKDKFGDEVWSELEQVTGRLSVSK